MSASRDYLKTVMSLTILLFILYSMFAIKPGYSRNGGLLFSNTFGGNGVDQVHDFCKTSDGGLLIVGSTTSFDADKEDVYIIKVNSSGGMEWNRTWGDWETDRGYSVIPTKDGNYVITGASGVKTGYGDDVLFLKIKGNGVVLSNYSYGGNAWDWGKDLVELPNGDILIAGVTEDFWISYYDCYLLRTTSKGKLVWKKTIDVEGNFDLNKMIESRDGNYLLLGTASNKFNTNNDIILIKIDEHGQELWRKTYGAEGRDEGADIVYAENGYIILGNKRLNNLDGYDSFIIKIDNDGKFLWSKNIGDVKDDKSYRIIETGDNEYSIVGQTFNTEDGSSDAVYTKINSEGRVIISEVYGTSQWDAGYLIYKDGENIVIIGDTRSTNRDIMYYKISPKVYDLEIITNYSSPVGAGPYFNNSLATISLEDEIVYIDRDTRHVFSGWISNSTWGVNSTQLKQRIVIRGNITQIANWTKQYYVEVFSTEGLKIRPASGWYDAGTNLTLRVTPEEGKSFVHWDGLGQGSFSGDSRRGEITVLGPIVEVPVFSDQRMCNLTLLSEYGSTSGNGTYYENSWVSFNVTPRVVDGRIGVRFVFRGWSSDRENGYNGEKNNGMMELTEDVNLIAIWQKQYFVNVSVGGDASVTGTEWHDEDEEIMITCEPNEGFHFDRWVGEGVGSYSGSSSSVMIPVKAPVSEMAFVSKSEPSFLNVLSEYGETMGSIYSFNGESVTFSVYPDVIPLTENTRVVFNGWSSKNGYGYTGSDNPATIVLMGDTVQEAVWSRQFYIESSDSELEGWYDENSSLPVDSAAEGVVVPKHKEFSANGKIISEILKITGPMTISSTWNYSLTTLAIAGISSSSIGFTAWSIMSRVAGLKGKRENGDEEKSEKTDKTGKSRFASLDKLGSRFKKEKIERVMEADDSPPEEPKKSTLSNLMKSRLKKRNAEASGEV